MKQRLFLLTVVFVVLLGAGTIAGANPLQQDDPIPPRVVELLPFEGEELTLDQPFTIYFDQAMDQDSVEAALSVEPEQDLNLSWEDDLSLVVAPPDAWQRDAELNFIISTDATSAAGLPMEDIFEATYHTIGYISVVEVLPDDGQTEVAADTPITVIFNRPVVPLVSLENLDELPNPITIDPALEGEGEWLNTSIYIFRPEGGLQGGRQHTVTVNAGLTSASGAILEEDFSWSFTTLMPQVLEVRPSDESSQNPLDQTVRVTFSQPMNPEITANAFSLTAEDGSNLNITGTIEWNDTNTVLTFTPDGLYILDTTYEVSVNRATARSASGARLSNSWRSTFLTVPYPEIIGTSPSDGSTAAQPYGGFDIYFSAPIDEDTLEDKVLIDPEPWRDYDTYFYSYDNRYSLFFDTEPSTTYTITILPGITDPYGNTIDDTTVVTYTTREYEAALNLNAPGMVGLYSAYNDNTRVFATHRNLSRLDLELYRLDLPTLANFVGYDSYDFRRSWVPPDGSLLRRWSINVQSQLNKRRYELLLLSEANVGSGIQNIQCLAAPEQLLRLGDRAQVSFGDPRPLRMRSDPNLAGEIVREIAPGTQFTLLDGPICADGYIWWQIDTGEDVGWSAEGTTANYFMELLERTEVQAPADEVDLEDFPGLAPGAYYMELTSPETQMQGYSSIEHVAVVSTVSIQMKFSPNQVMAWVTDMKTGEPVPDIPVFFYNEAFEAIGKLDTNADGIALLEIPRLEDLYKIVYASVVTEEQFGFNVSNWDNGLDPWRFGLTGDYAPENLSIYMYSDRPIYRPGQPVYFRGVVRNRDDVTFTLPRGLDGVPVQVYDPENQVVYEGTMPLTPHGTFSGEFELDGEAALGYYRLVANVSSNQRSEFNMSFNVAEYQAPEFQVQVTPAQSEVVQGDDIEVLVESSYFFGGAVSNATITWTALSRNYYFNYQGTGRYDFVDYNYDLGPGEYYDEYGEAIADGEGITDASGNFIITLPAELGERTQSQEITIEARVTDESDQLVAGRTQIVVHQGKVYVGLVPAKYIGTATQDTLVNLLAVDWESDGIAEQEVDYRVVERRWSNVKEEDELGRTVWTWEVEEIDIDEGTLITDADGKGQLSFVPPNGGVFKVYATTRDDVGNEISTSTFMWVTGSDYVSWRQQNSNTFDLITDADNYKVGDTAEILIASPFQGRAVALVTVERGGILTHTVIRMEGNSAVYQLPITPNFAPNIFVSVVVVKGEDENNPYAQFRMGMAQLSVDTEQLGITVEVESNVDVDAGEFAGPGDEVSYTVTTTDWEGNPVSAEVGIGVTDLAVLTIAPPNSRPLMDFFYSERGVSVRTSTSLTVSVDQLTQTIIDTVKGGGGGGAEQGIFDIREEFVDTPGWEPSLVTDENGEATYTLTLPDNLTTWRLDARAVTDGEDGPMLVGQTTFDLLSTKPLLVRPITPRFMIVNDEVEFGAIVNNNTSTEQVVEISMEGSGFLLLDGQELTQTVTIPSKGRQRVNWRVQVLNVPTVDLTFFANGNDGEFTDATKPTLGQGDDKTLPVYKYEVPETVGTAGALYEGGSRSEVIALPRQFDVTQGELTVKLDRSLAAATIDGLDYLQNFEHQCIEQTVSRFLPNIMTSAALTQLGVENPALKANLDQAVSFALQRLYSQQRTDGGWGWFPNYRSSPIVTAYALIGLVEARNNGYSVDQNVINRAADYLEARINEYPRNPQRWERNRQAFLIYAATRAGFFQASAAANLYEDRLNLNIDAKAYLVMAMHAMNAADPRTENLLSDFSSTAIVSATGIHWEDQRDYYNWTTDTRTTALVLMAYVQMNPDSQLIPNIVRWLMVGRKADHWETTQETAWSVMALTDWMVASNELNADYSFSLGLNGAEQALEDDTALRSNIMEREQLVFDVAELLKDEANRLTIARTDGPGNLYYTAHLEVFLPVPEVEAASRGVIVDRRYYAFHDDSGEPITEGRVGDQVEVVLTIIAPNDLNFVVVEDPIPAGSAAVDPNLLTSSVISERPQLDRVNPLSRGWGWWYFSRTEFRDEKVVMYADFLPRGTYEFRYTIRLGLQGEYNVIPPTAQEFYFPEVYGRGNGSLFTILPTLDEEAVASE